VPAVQGEPAVTGEPAVQGEFVVPGEPAPLAPRGDAAPHLSPALRARGAGVAAAAPMMY